MAGFAIGNRGEFGHGRARAVRAGGIGSPPTKADGDGAFRFSDVEPGGHSLYAKKQGFVPPEMGDFVELTESREKYVLRITPFAKIRGRVVDGSGDPIEQATVLVMAKLGWGRSGHRVVKSVETDDRGQYRIWDLPAGSYLIQVGPPASRRGYYDRLVELPEQGTVQLEIVAGADGGEVKGKVRADGKIVQGAQVVLAPRKESENPEEYHGYVSDTDGSFRFKAVRPGQYVLFATSDRELDYADSAAIREYVETAKVVRVEARGSLEVQLELQRR